VASDLAAAEPFVTVDPAERADAEQEAAGTQLKPVAARLQQ
jgi:hypothetical protein